MSKRYAWSRNIDDEIWRGGPCDSIRECVEEAQAEDYELDDKIAIGYVVDYKINHDFSDDIVCRLAEEAFDEVGEASDGWLDSAKKEELEILNDRVTEVIKQWLKEIHEEPTFFKIEPFEFCTLKDAKKLNENKPKGGKK